MHRACDRILSRSCGRAAMPLGGDWWSCFVCLSACVCTCTCTCVRYFFIKSRTSSSIWKIPLVSHKVLVFASLFILLGGYSVFADPFVQFFAFLYLLRLWELDFRIFFAQV